MMKALTNGPRGGSKNGRSNVEANRLFNDAALDRKSSLRWVSPRWTGTGLSKSSKRVARIHSFWHDANDQPPNGEIHEWLGSFVSAVRKVRTLLTHPPGDDPRFLAKLIFIAGHDRHDISQVRRAVEESSAGGDVWEIATRQILWSRPDRVAVCLRALVDWRDATEGLYAAFRGQVWLLARQFDLSSKFSRS